MLDRVFLRGGIGLLGGILCGLKGRRFAIGRLAGLILRIGGLELGGLGKWSAWRGGDRGEIRGMLDGMIGLIIVLLHLENTIMYMTWTIINNVNAWGMHTLAGVGVVETRFRIRVVRSLVAI